MDKSIKMARLSARKLGPHGLELGRIRGAVGRAQVVDDARELLLAEAAQQVALAGVRPGADVSAPLPQDQQDDLQLARVRDRRIAVDEEQLARRRECNEVLGHERALGRDALQPLDQVDQAQVVVAVVLLVQPRDRADRLLGRVAGAQQLLDDLVPERRELALGVVALGSHGVQRGLVEVQAGARLVQQILSRNQLPRTQPRDGLAVHMVRRAEQIVPSVQALFELAHHVRLEADVMLLVDRLFEEVRNILEACDGTPSIACPSSKSHRQPVIPRQVHGNRACLAQAPLEAEVQVQRVQAVLCAVRVAGQQRVRKVRQEAGQGLLVGLAHVAKGIEAAAVAVPLEDRAVRTLVVAPEDLVAEVQERGLVLAR
eukprot:m.241562 g.241562  ORF g.241562 m.241562 type:complete len:372 (-) comp13872_c0_seq1:2494-3609(-)